MENARGRIFLLVVGIIMIVIGAIGIFASILTLALGDTFNSILGGSVVTTELIILSFIIAAVQLVVGILGVAFSKKPEKAMVCIVLAVVYIICSVIIDVISGASIVGIIFGLILPVLYLIGGVKNKQSVQ